MNHDTTSHGGPTRRGVLRSGAVVSTALGLGLTAGAGHVAATGEGELIESIASEAGLSTKAVETSLDAFIDATTMALKTDDRVAWVGFGSFSISKRSARTGRNPRRGEHVETSARNGVEFSCSAELAAALGLTRDCDDDDPHATPITADRLAREAGITAESAKAFLDAFIDATTKALKKGDRLSLVGFGSFSISKRSARTGRNPRTGKEIRIARGNGVKFKAGAELSKSVN